MHSSTRATAPSTGVETLLFFFFSSGGSCGSEGEEEEEEETATEADVVEVVAGRRRRCRRRRFFDSSRCCSFRWLMLAANGTRAVARARGAMLRDGGATTRGEATPRARVVKRLMSDLSFEEEVRTREKLFFPFLLLLLLLLLRRASLFSFFFQPFRPSIASPSGARLLFFRREHVSDSGCAA